MNGLLRGASSYCADTCNGMLTWMYTVEQTEWPLARIGGMGSPLAFQQLLQFCHSNYVVIIIILFLLVLWRQPNKHTVSFGNRFLMSLINSRI